MYILQNNLNYSQIEHLNSFEYIRIPIYLLLSRTMKTYALYNIFILFLKLTKKVKK